MTLMTILPVPTVRARIRASAINWQVCHERHSPGFYALIGEGPRRALGPSIDPFGAPPMASGGCARLGLVARTLGRRWVADPAVCGNPANLQHRLDLSIDNPAARAEPA